MDLTGETHFITVTIGGKTYSGLLREVKEEAATAMATSDDSQFDRSQMVLRSQI